MIKNTAPADPGIARLLQGYAAQYGAAPDAKGGAGSAQIALTVDDKFQIRLRALPAGGIALHARLMPLPEPGPQRDEMLLGAARLACGTMREHAAACVVDERERALWLQQAARTNSQQDIDDAVGSFVNCLALWTEFVKKL